MVIYNRVPKTASASVVHMARRAAERSNGRITVVQDEAHYKRRYSATDLVKEAATLFLPPLRTRTRLFHSHQFFYDFAELYNGQLATINMIRDPVDRCVSAFYWTARRSTARTLFDDADTLDVNKWAKRGGFDLPPAGFIDTPRVDAVEPPQGTHTSRLDLALAHIADECNNYYTKWFCGHSAECMRSDTKEALEQALYNIRHKHLAIGVTEQFELSMRMFGTLLPVLFGAAVGAEEAGGEGAVAAEAEQRAQDKHLGELLHRTESYTPVTPATRAILQERNANDYKIYEEVKQRLADFAEQCRLGSES